MPSIFAYGTLKDPLVRRRILGHDVPGLDAQVSGYETQSIEIEGKPYPAAIEGWGTLEGQVFCVTASELALLDEYETDAYRRIEVETTIGERAFMYAKR